MFIQRICRIWLSYDKPFNNTASYVKSQYVQSNKIKRKPKSSLNIMS